MANAGARLLVATSLFAIAAAVQAGETTTYSYDALGRLTASSSSGSVNDGVTSSIGYDAAGNRSIYAASKSGAPAFSISGGGAVEGGGLVFTVIKNGTGAASVVFTTANGSAGSNDYYGASGSLSFAAGESSKTITLALIDDSVDEPSETILLSLFDPSAGSTIADAQAVGTIFDNDEPPPPPPPPPPVFSISDASATEGGAVVFTVTKTGAAVSVFGVSFATANDTASAFAGGGPYVDYHAASGNLYFQAGETTKTITIQGSDDPFDEPDETFFLNLTGFPGGATISDAQGIGTILDNDDPPPPSPGNTPPTAVDDRVPIHRCATKSFDVLANDSDADGDTPLTVVGVAGVGFSFTSTQVTVDSTDHASEDYGYYAVQDARGAQSTAKLTIYFNGGSCTQ